MTSFSLPPIPTPPPSGTSNEQYAKDHAAWRDGWDRRFDALMTEMRPTLDALISRMRECGADDRELSSVFEALANELYTSPVYDGAGGSELQ